MTIQELRQRRHLARIPGRLICIKADISRTRLSELECGYVQPSDAELNRLAAALEELIKAREKMAELALEYGWPSSAI